MQATAKEAVQVHGTNPQFLLEKVVRTRIWDSIYWKEHCFALTAASLCEKAAELTYIGGLAHQSKPSEFLSLLLKLLQLQPEREILQVYLTNPDFKYLTALAAIYVRLTENSVRCYEFLEPLLMDRRKLRYRDAMGNFALTYMDVFVDQLLNEERVCDTTLPRLTRREVLVEAGDLEVRISPLEEELERMLEAGAELGSVDGNDEGVADIGGGGGGENDDDLKGNGEANEEGEGEEDERERLVREQLEFEQKFIKEMEFKEARQNGESAVATSDRRSERYVDSRRDTDRDHHYDGTRERDRERDRQVHRSRRDDDRYDRRYRSRSRSRDRDHNRDREVDRPRRRHCDSRSRSRSRSRDRRKRSRSQSRDRHSRRRSRSRSGRTERERSREHRSRRDETARPDLPAPPFQQQQQNPSTTAKATEEGGYIPPLPSEKKKKSWSTKKVDSLFKKKPTTSEPSDAASSQRAAIAAARSGGGGGGGGGDEGMSIEETNAMRIKLGLKPLKP
ncbi:hypothetical protein HDV05_002697 [Chytridiales sp. JEL 0842]|nr:hypothetical protein HDV05_002697 [Chytridiales sp. JEL 0842]